jgi:hypothetical protein
MKKMNGLPLEYEPGTIGYEQLDCAGFNRALNAWAKRRGISWDSPFKRSLTFGKSKKKTTPCASAQ